MRLVQWQIKPFFYIIYGRSASLTPVRKEQNIFHINVSKKPINMISLL